jgi:hypothetical protein
MADVAVDTGVFAGFQLRAQRSGPVWTDEDTGYIFFINSANDVRYRKTTDGGASWAASVLIDATTAISLDIWFDKWTPGDSGTLIHVWWLESTSDDLHYRSLDTSTDTLGTDRIVFAGTSFSSTFDRTSHAVSGTKAVGGNLYVQFWGDTAGERGFYRSVDAGVAWTSRTDGADGDAPDEVICLPDDDSADNQDIVMIYWDRSANEISIKKYDDSGNSWGETSISGSMSDTNLIMQMSAVVRHSDGHIIVAAWSNIDSATADLKVWDITLATPTITAKTDVVTDSDDCVGAALFIDQNNDDLYCAYLGDEDGSETWQSTLTAFYKKSDDGAGTWGAQTAYQEGAADDERYIDAGHSTPGSAAGRFEPVFFNADLLDLFVNKVNSVEITVAVAGQPTMIRTQGVPTAPGARDRPGRWN